MNRNELEEKAIERVEELLKDEIFDECVVVSDAERCYIEGYKDAQKETVDKACKWLMENKDHPFIGCEDCCLSGYLTDEFIEEFKKAMEGKK